MHGFLGSEQAARLLDFAIASETLFTATVVGREDELNPRIRQSSRLETLGEFIPIIASAVEKVLPGILPTLGIRPFTVGAYEIELVAHAEGGFYSRHIDTYTGNDRTQCGDRVLSCVYYIHSQPKQFTGGALRLYPLPTSEARTPACIDVEPDHETLVAFSSWLPHEVMPTVCPTKQFKDCRFSINCWVYQQSEPTAAREA